MYKPPIGSPISSNRLDMNKVKIEIIEVKAIDKNKIMVKLQAVNKNETFTVNTKFSDILLSIFGFEDIHGKFITEGKYYSAGMLDPKNVVLEYDKKLQINVCFDIEKDYFYRVNKIMEAYIPIIVKIKSIDNWSRSVEGDELEYITTCEPYDKLKMEDWIDIAKKFGYYDIVLKEYQKYLIKIILSIVIIIIFYFSEAFQKLTELFELIKRIWK